MVDFEQVNIGWDTDTTFFERFPYLFNKRNFMTLEVSHGTFLFLLFCFHCLCVCLHSFLWFVLFSSKVFWSFPFKILMSYKDMHDINYVAAKYDFLYFMQILFNWEQCVVTNTVKSVLQSEEVLHMHWCLWPLSYVTLKNGQRCFKNFAFLTP